MVVADVGCRCHYIRTPDRRDDRSANYREKGLLVGLNPCPLTQDHLSGDLGERHFAGAAILATRILVRQWLEIKSERKNCSQIFSNLPTEFA